MSNLSRFFWYYLLIVTACTMRCRSMQAADKSIRMKHMSCSYFQVHHICFNGVFLLRNPAECSLFQSGWGPLLHVFPISVPLIFSHLYTVYLLMKAKMPQRYLKKRCRSFDGWWLITMKSQPYCQKRHDIGQISKIGLCSMTMISNVQMLTFSIFLFLI